MRKFFLFCVAFFVLFYVASFFYFPLALYSLILIGPILTIGIYDILQTSHAIRRNYPLVGNFRYWLEAIRPEINQYFVESDTNGAPLNREERSLMYQRAKKVRDTIPFGTKRDVYGAGYEWVNHSLEPKHIMAKDARINVGGKDCKQPYSCSLLNISAMSFGALSPNAILALNRGAKMGGFAHNTGEGGISPYHTKHGGDLIWQVGTGYFGCRNKNGEFDPELFREKSNQEQVKMIEIKLSQGAKPGHGGILPKTKITKEIAEIRNVSMDKDVLSPPGHSAFSNPIEFMEFIAKLREFSGGKPIGFKLCVGRRDEFFALCKAMRETEIFPDYIAVDGGEGGTGAAPVEFSNSMGMPLYDGLVFVSNALRGFDLKDHIKVFAGGKLTTAFGMIKRISLGADALYSARAFMLSLGCIQALKCNSNECPAGVATQNKGLAKGLVVNDKYVRVKNYHREMIRAFCELLGSMGLESTDELFPDRIHHRLNFNTVKTYKELFPPIEKGALLEANPPEQYAKFLNMASSGSFQSR